jgi:hypothetical protein
MALHWHLTLRKRTQVGGAGMNLQSFQTRAGLRGEAAQPGFAQRIVWRVRGSASP